jgi:hypothetical protein
VYEKVYLDNVYKSKDTHTSRGPNL